MRQFLPFVLLLIIPSLITAQKEIYIPNEWSSGNFDYSMERSAESDNFVIFWGPLAGLDPTHAPSDIAFKPEEILLVAEDVYSFFIDSLEFLSDSSGLLSEWKVILVILHTWEGLEGWAFGGQYDATVGAMWMHPHAASTPSILAHEFTHVLQNYAWMMYPGHGFINHDYVGFFWEAHAEFMTLQYYPDLALYFDLSRWMNTSQQHWSSTRHHYQAFIFLEFIREFEGMEIINRMWRESVIGEHPLETYMRLTGRDQQELNDLFGYYAMRNVVWDYEIGDLLRQHAATMPEQFRLNPTIIPEAKDQENGFYQIQDHRAPQDYGYNHIRLFPTTADSCEESIVHIRFRAYEEVAAHAGLRWGLVAVNGEGIPRYSELKRDNGELIFPLEENEDTLYLVVSGAPSVHHNYAWEIGFPKIYRYPYAFRVDGASPEGYQPGYSRVPEGVSGAPHPNGGGFVASTASVAATAWVDSTAVVLDHVVITDRARIEGHALLKHNARVEDDALVSGFATVGGYARIYEQGKVSGHANIWGNTQVFGEALVNGHTAVFYSLVYDSATVTDNTFCWGAELSGNVYLGGDAEFFIPCSTGIYLQFQGAYGRQCDGLVDHPANEPVNSPYENYNLGDLPFLNVVDCGGTTSILQPVLRSINGILIYPNPVFGNLHIDTRGLELHHTGEWNLHTVLGKSVKSGTFRAGEIQQLNIQDLAQGLYFIRFRSGEKKMVSRIMVGGE